jgi:hypothetical protein
MYVPISLVAGRSRSREGGRLGIANERDDQVDMDFHGVFVDGRYRETQENEDDDMSLQSDNMSISSTERDDMDTTEEIARTPK